MITRFRELGIYVESGAVKFLPRLLREHEFIAKPRAFRYLDIDDQWQQLSVPAAGIAFTWCQVPMVYALDDSAEPSITISCDDGTPQTLSGLALPVERSAEIFQRSGRIRRLDLVFGRSELYSK